MRLPLLISLAHRAPIPTPNPLPLFKRSPLLPRNGDVSYNDGETEVALDEEALKEQVMGGDAGHCSTPSPIP